MTQATVCSTGIEGLDAILAGGLPRDRMYAIEGTAGVGKTTLALQFLMEGVQRGEKGLYISLSETKPELESVARSHGWSLDDVAVVDMSTLQQFVAPAQSTVFHSSEVELNQATKTLIKNIEDAEPSRIVFDSLFEMRLLAQSPIRYRRQMLALKQVFGLRKCTVLLLEDTTLVPSDMQIANLVNGVIQLESMKTEYGSERRRLSITKLRGVNFIGGSHDYVIRKGGLQVFPRLIAYDRSTDYPTGIASSGLKNLDLLLGGGLNRGTSSLILGPAGSGKSIIVTQFAYAAAERGDRVLVLSFEESTRNMMERAKLLGVPLDQHVANGIVTIMQIDPADVTPGELAQVVMKRVEKHDVKVVVIDSLNGYLQAMPQEQFLILHMHELLAFLGRQGVVTLMILAQHGLVIDMSTPVDVTYLADTVVVLRYFEVHGHIRKAISVVKRRNGPHENTIREMSIVNNRLVIGEQIEGLQGVLTGPPVTEIVSKPKRRHASEPAT
ncbi:MAG: AAA family ATPase [Planctomycetes bacterium]|nr:AAA family ATPase [Planctomycetota bacterium]